MEDVNTPVSHLSIPPTPESKPRDLAASERRLAIIRAAFASASQPTGSPTLGSTPLALDVKRNKGEVINSESYPGNLWGNDFDLELRSAPKQASTFKDNSSGLVTPGTSIIAGNMSGGTLSPKKRRFDMDDAENNPFLARSHQSRANSLDMSNLEAHIDQLVKEGVKEALTAYTIEQQAELRLLRGQVKSLQAKVQALENWRPHPESNRGTGT